MDLVSLSEENYYLGGFFLLLGFDFMIREVVLACLLDFCVHKLDISL